ncbi:MAG TPA: carbamoyltransferase HypF, partial [Raoultella ornithinolytica]|nr:carbamoyltransferase HypF [Raoultella ornithinolytica]
TACDGVAHPVRLPWQAGELDLATFWPQWLGWRAIREQKAWAFHDALACGVAAMARDCATSRGMTTLAFSGGVLHNRLLVSRLTFYLADFTLLFPQQLPAGDGAIAFGQAVVAAARWQAHRISS